MPPHTVLDADICVIGAGAAGLSLIQGLRGRGIRVVLVESGGRSDPEAQDHLNRGLSNLADYPFQATRARVFGGTTSLWTGACIPLDPVDFAARPWLPNSGWPITARDLDPYCAQARAIFGLPAVAPRASGDLPFGSGALQQKTVEFSAPLNLATRFDHVVAADEGIVCVLNATVAELTTEAGGGSVRAARLVMQGGNTATVTARLFVVATGGIENARLLLNSRDRHAAGLGNAADNVGRFHMEHPIRSVGLLALAGDPRAALAFTNRTTVDGTQSEQTFGLSADIRTREQLMDLHVRLYRYSPLEAHPAVTAGKTVALAPDAGKLIRYLARHAHDVPFTLAPYLYWHLKNKYSDPTRNAPAPPPFRHVRLTAFVEQEPDPSNRITLSAERDAFGLRLPHLQFSESPTMQESIARSLGLMARDLAERGIGTLVHQPEDFWHVRFYDKYGLHQMGTTRMSEDPRHGVLDRNLRVHGLSNLFVTGSSVFPTGGAANPTFTISALSLRLADHAIGMLRSL